MIKIVSRFILLISFLFCFSVAFPQTISPTLKQKLESSLDQAKKLESNGNLNGALSIYNKTATSYWVNGNLSKASKVYLQAASVAERLNNKNALKVIYTNLGMIFVDLEQYTDANAYFQKCLKINRAQKKKSEIASTLINIASTYKELGKYQEALSYCTEANTLAIEENNAKLLKNSYSLLAEIYEALGDSKKSAECFSLYSAFSRKIQREEMLKKDAQAKKIVEQAKGELQSIKTQKELTEKELNQKQQVLETVKDSLQKVERITKQQQLEIDLLNKENALREERIKNQILIRNIFIVIIAATLGMLGLITHYYVQKKRSNEELAKQKAIVEAKSLELLEALKKIEKQNKDITSSINYAQRIQQALLPTYDQLVSCISDSFIMFRPRETVSGDFFWFNSYGGQNVAKGPHPSNMIVLNGVDPDEFGFLIAAVDCTGHGVPGAFMSMIGLNLLDVIVRSGTIQPDLILNELHRQVRHLLKQENNDSRDGMDMALIRIKGDGKTIEFAGAKNPVVYITNDECFTIKGDPVPVGGLQKEAERKFTLKTFTIDSPTCVYLFSDGYIDQFGGPEGLKFTSKRFKELLVKIHQKPMVMQQEELETVFDDWKSQSFGQIDDVLVVGLRLNATPFKPEPLFVNS
ncbi:tetratricopeptide repeat protein [Tenuifilum thalassicum]|uniref:Tetratricopeptide repeat protein n=1 Tax=Tenuifilum thalassicum TaxID=2590900 RepID=A0A7D3XLF5_9BACT|nr:tetratricopeptide repeat protein [Tenuifilum thalassicum]QKG79336.1 tetratricopeptide repeat protein [Tenuifilum thalassicum]